jgi:hypothetical protein
MMNTKEAYDLLVAIVLHSKDNGKEWLAVLL